ncbi:MAG: peptidoglycan DD-metalloendopeptidase family protein [Prevotella sp.]|nr:peptidoglycan DD-metalloendopeptidase family protein [Prevotella sp.]
MRRIGVILVLLSFALSPYAQQKRTPAKGKGKTTAVAKKKTVTKKTTTKKTTSTAKSSKQPVSVQSLQSQREKIQQQIKEQEQRLRSNERDVKKRLENLMILNTEIAVKRRTIDTIRKDLSSLEVEIEVLNTELAQLKSELDDCKEKYVKSMRYMHRNQSMQSKLMFIFSANSFAQMYRRMRFMREYASYQRSQGEDVKVKQAEVNAKQVELLAAHDNKTQLLARGESERRSLEGKQTEQKNVVSGLQKQQKEIQNVIAQQKKKDAALNAQIDRLIAEEVARQKARAAAEAKRKAEAEAAKKRAAELARKKAAAEAAAKENARRVAEAKAREEKAKAEARAARNKKAREEAERKAKEAEATRLAAERRAESEAREHAKEVAEAKKNTETLDYTMSTDDRRISGNFESNRGRLPMPITGPYRIVSHFGQYNVEGLHNVTLDNKGINIKGQSGAQARSIFDGEVSAVFSFGGTMVVMVRHGSYISVYCNLVSVNVHKGQKVTTRQVLGKVGQDDILQFQLRKETAKLNPESWLGR